MEKTIAERFFIIGNYGAGKSTFAHRMGQLLEISPIHLDTILWEPGWKDRPMADALERLRQITASDRWIVEGISDYKGQSGLHDLCFDSADTILLFDFPQLLCWWRIFKRRWQYHGRTRPDLPDGYPEKLYRIFLQKVWNYPKDERPVIFEKINRLPKHKRVIYLKTPGQVKNFLESLESKQMIPTVEQL